MIRRYRKQLFVFAVLLSAFVLVGAWGGGYRSSRIDGGNSSDTPLGIGGVFTGNPVDISGCSGIGIRVEADAASATNGLEAQFSKNGTTWFIGEAYTVAAGGEKFFTPPAGQGLFFRVKYTNGAVAQTAFDLFVVLKNSPFKWSSHNIVDAISGSDDAELVKNVNTGEDPDGVYRNVTVTKDGNLTISDNSSGLSIAQGNVTGASYIHKFGETPNFDSGDGLVTIWDGADDSLFSGSPPMVMTYSTTADIGTVSSSSASDTGDVEIQGLDADYNIVIQTATLQGQADVLLGTNLIRAFRVKNISTSDITGVMYTRTNGSGQALGVPSTANTVRAIVNNGNNQTLMAVYTIPAGKTGYMRSFYADIVGANKTSNYKVKLVARPFGQVFQVKHVKGLSESGTSSVIYKYEDPEAFAEKTDIELRVETTDSPITDVNISGGFDIVLIDN